MAVKFYSGILILLFPFCLSAQIDSAHHRQSFFKTPIIKSVVAPTLLTAIGLFTQKQNGFLNKYAIEKYLQGNIGKTHVSIDDYLAFAPMASVTGLNWSGVRPKNDFYNRTLLMVKSEILMLAIVNGIKYSSKQIRPDSSDYLSFPSGHTAQAFMSATLLHKEFKDKSIWYSVAGYTTASIVGLLRILNNKHWAPDVLVGAATGILSVNLVYLTHTRRTYHKRKWKTANIYPYLFERHIGLGLSWDL